MGQEATDEKLLELIQNLPYPNREVFEQLAMEDQGTTQERADQLAASLHCTVDEIYRLYEESFDQIKLLWETTE